MANLYEIQRQRLKRYGQILKMDLTQKKIQQKNQKELLLRQDSLELERHIENTKKFNREKLMEIKEMNNAVKEDNLMLSTLKRNASFTANYAQNGQNFVSQIHQMDNKRLSKLKDDLLQQYNDNRDFSCNKKQIQEKIRQIQRIQERRHSNHIKQMQIESVKNYQEIKRKHQQNMQLFDMHKRLVEENQGYRQQIEGFTKKGNRGLLDRYNRNQYLQRRASLRQNQEHIKRQMQELEQRKSQDAHEYKRKVADLQDSMLASILSKPPRYEPKTYSNQLKMQMQDDSLKRLQEINLKKQKIDLNNIYGGVHSSQRHKMIEIIDKRLGIDKYGNESMPKISKRAQEFKAQNLPQINPEINEEKSQAYLMPRNKSRGNSISKKQEDKIDYSEQIIPNVDTKEINPSQRSMSQLGNSQNRRYFKSFDVITGKNRFYGAQ